MNSTARTPLKPVNRLTAVLMVACHPEWSGYDIASVSGIVEAFFARMSRLTFVNHLTIWTRVEAIAHIAGAFGFEFLPQETETYSAVPYGLDLPLHWKKEISRRLVQTIGTTGNIQVYVDLSHVLLQTETIEKMFDAVMEAEAVHEVAAATPVEPHLYLETAEGLRQIFDQPGLDRQQMPGLYRICGASIRHGLRPRPAMKKTALHCVPWTEAMRFDPDYIDYFRARTAAMSREGGAQ